VDLARETGIAAMSVINSSHFGAAGAYVLHAAERGFAALGVCNSDSFVLAHDGVEPFHGTNPLAFAAPVSGSKPYLVDMATSVMPWNRVQDLMAKGLPLPEDVSVNSSGEPTVDPTQSAALLPLGGVRYGYKGAALASMIEVLSAVMSGMPHCSRLLGMPGPDLSSPRRLGHFFLVIDPGRFVSTEVYDAGMRAYLGDLRRQRAKQGTKVMAPGDREWEVEEDRRLRGVPISPQLKAQLDDLGDRLHVPRLINTE
jgi:LDH2 family malate/lactate/ureidoglycolate dehydrogenase